MPFDLNRLNSLLADPGRFSVSYLSTTASTMDDARAAARQGAPDGRVVVAGEQTAGRGRFGRRWVAPPDANLLFTLVTRPRRDLLERLSVIAALSVAEAVEAVSGVAPIFKWPNDVLVEGRKLAGILVEAEFSGETPSFALVGVGLNVNARTPELDEIASLAVSLLDLTSRTHERETLLAAFLNAYDQWRSRASSDVMQAWSGRLATLGQSVRVSFAGRIEDGVAESVTETGALVLRRHDGTAVTLPAGEVSLRAT